MCIRSIDLTFYTPNTHVYAPSLSILLIHMYMILTFYTPNTHVYDPSLSILLIHMHMTLSIESEGSYTCVLGV
jgi:hypothetical protein